MPSGANKKSSGAGGGKGKKQQDNKKQPLANNQKDDKVKEPADEDINSGFGDYMRSSQGWSENWLIKFEQIHRIRFPSLPSSTAAEMMKLFVIANTLVVFLTMAWPQMKHSYEIIQSMIYGDEDGEL